MIQYVSAQYLRFETKLPQNFDVINQLATILIDPDLLGAGLTLLTTETCSVMFEHVHQTHRYQVALVRPTRNL